MQSAEETLLDGRLNVSRETFHRLTQFQALIKKWSKQINLVASSTTQDTWRRHIEDSAQLLLLKPHMKSVVDIGSGGGFPGIILAILLDKQPHTVVHLIESNRKKTAFLQAVRVECAKRARIYAQRIEVALPLIEKPEYITARAVASLEMLLTFTQCHLTQGSVALFHKGREFKNEIEESRAHWDYDLIVHKSEIDDESVILEISKLRIRS